MLTLGGRKFTAVTSSTIEWDTTLFRLLQGIGLTDVHMHVGETTQRLAERIYRTVMGSEALFEILGCVLVPEGADPFKWTPSLMQSTADYIRGLHEPADKGQINSQIVSLVISFFQQGLLSITTSASYSKADGEARVRMTPPGAALSEISISAPGA